MVEIVRPPIRQAFAEQQPNPDSGSDSNYQGPVPTGGPDFNDGVRMIDPNTGQPMRSELDQIEMPAMNDYLRATYQVLVWASASLKALAQTTPAFTGLNPEIEKTVDQVATLGYQITNAGAEATRALWNWPYSRVIINKQVEQFIHPTEWSTFDVLYTEWYMKFIQPVEGTGKQPDAKDLAEWLKGKPEIADAQAFVQLCVNRLRMERAAAQSAWTPTDMLALQRPTGVRQTTTTELHKVFRKRPG